MSADSVSPSQGWEQIWAEESNRGEYWNRPEPPVVEWVRKVSPIPGPVLDLGCGILAEIYRVLQPGSPLYITFVGRVPERIDRFRADVERGVCREIEPFTFIYTREAPDDKDILHHYTDRAELTELLSSFEIETLAPVWNEYADDVGRPCRSLHYHVQARRPG